MSRPAWPRAARRCAAPLRLRRLCRFIPRLEVLEGRALPSHSDLTGGYTLLAVEGAFSAPQTIATFTIQSPHIPEGYTAEVSWGDGSVTDAELSLDPETSLVSVLGSHLYTEEGEYDIAIRVHAGLPAIDVVYSTAEVSDPAVVLNGGFLVYASAGVDSGLQTVATFADPGGPKPADEYASTVAWGDGQSSAGAIRYDESAGYFVVEARHTYADTGRFPIAITVSHGSAPDAKTESVAEVSEAALLVRGGLTVLTAEGQDSGLQAVATFTDPSGARPTDQYAAAIDWGDGRTSDGVIAYDQTTGVFTVLGSHLYQEEGHYQIAVTVRTGQTEAEAVYSDAEVSDPAVVVAGGFSVQAAEGADSGNQVVATFTDPGGAEPAGEYRAVISWGDGVSSTGLVSRMEGADSFVVAGTHTYAEEGRYVITVTVGHGTAPDAIGLSEAVVADPAVLLSAGPRLSAVEGADTGLRVLATFTDPGGAEPTREYTATISWGDEQTSAGVIVYDANAARFAVLGGHRYLEEGAYTVTVTVSHGAAADARVTLSALVADPAVVLAGGRLLLSSEGAGSGTQILATFTDPGAREAPAEYSATISWGDGRTSAGLIQYDGESNVFMVLGGHRYLDPGDYTITITVTHGSATPAVATSAAVISDPAVILSGGLVVQASEGTDSGLQAVATFTDPGGPGPLAEYAATIDWGDGQSSAGVIRYDAEIGRFTILGSHVYAEQGDDTATITVSHGPAPAVSTTAAVTVSDAGLALNARDIAATEGVPFRGVVASFTDGNSLARASHFTATVSWGDGSTSAGVVTADGRGGFDVTAAHAYADGGTYTLIVTLSDRGALTAAAGRAAVQDVAPMVALGGAPSALVGADYVLTVAAFEPGTDHLLRLTVSWGDGTSDTVSPGITTGTFLLAHRYVGAPAVYTVSATFVDEDGVHAAANTVPVTALVAGITNYATATSTPGHPGTAELAGVGESTLTLPADLGAGAFGTLFMGAYGGNPTGFRPAGFALEYVDFRLQLRGVTDGSGATLVVHLGVPDGVNLSELHIQFFDGSRWQLVSAAGARVGVDAEGRFIEFTITGASFPRLTALTGSVFTVSVNTTNPALATILPPVALAATTGAASDLGASGGLTTPAAFLQSSQLTLVLSTSPGSAGIRGGDSPLVEMRSDRDDRLLHSLDLLLRTLDPLPAAKADGTGEPSGAKSGTTDRPPAPPDTPKPNPGPAQKLDKPSEVEAPPPEAVIDSWAAAGAFGVLADDGEFLLAAPIDGEFQAGDALSLALAVALALPMTEILSGADRVARRCFAR